MISVIIPAHNEEAVIDRCITALLNGHRENELEIIVSCNGCTDRTAEKARAFGSPVKVIETQTASKTAALNAADAVAVSYPRAYVDADVVLPLESLRLLAELLKQEGTLLASPVADADTSRSTAPVRDFYAIWMQLPYNQVMVGTGVYVLSAEGRARFREFPHIIGDDAFVRSLFCVEERSTDPKATVQVIAPRTWTDLIRVKTRSRVGGFQLADKYPNLKASDPKNLFRIITSFPLGPRLPIQLFVYLWLSIEVRIRARRQLKGHLPYRWERDEFSRSV